MGLIIEKQKTKEEDGKGGHKKGEKVEKGIRERVKRVPWKKSDKETRERERKLKGRVKENGDKSAQTENGRWKERPSEKGETKNNTGEEIEERIAIIDGEELEIEEEEELARKWMAEDGERVLTVCVSGRSLDADVDEEEEEEENPFGGVGVRFQEKKQPRYPSSRPTSLETIVEDSPSPFSFQEAIISSSLDSRAIYRDGRGGSPESLLGRSRGAFQEVPGTTDGLRGDVLLRKEKRIVVFPVAEENVPATDEDLEERTVGIPPAEDNVLAPDEELEEITVVIPPAEDNVLAPDEKLGESLVVIPLAEENVLAPDEELEGVRLETREPGVDLVVVCGRREAGGGGTEDLPAGTGEVSSGLLVPAKGSPSSISCLEDTDEAPIKKDTKDNEDIKGVRVDETVNAGTSVNDDYSEGVRINENTSEEVDANDVCTEGVHPKINSSEGLHTNDCTSEGRAGYNERPQGAGSEESSPWSGRDDPHAGPTDEDDDLGGRDDGGGRYDTVVRRQDDRRKDATVLNDNLINGGGYREEGGINPPEGAGEGSVVVILGHDGTGTPQEGEEGAAPQGHGAAPEEGGQKPPEVSFNIFLEFEALTEEVAAEGEEDMTVQGGHQAGPRYQQEFVKAIQSLDSLNDQIVEFIFSGTDFDDDNGGSPKQREALKSSMALMRRLLVDAQSKFRKMVEDNKQLASRIDSDLQTAHQEVNLLRQELADTNRRITQLQAHTSPPPDSTTTTTTPTTPPATTTTINGSSKYHSESSSNQLVEELSQLRLENEKLSVRNRSLQSEVEELRRVKENIAEEDLQLKPRINEMTIELTHAKEALSALKADRKRLKAEKFDLLNQMKQLYATLEDKEKELRDFIRNYEQRMKESDESLRHLAAERDETEREKWNILKHARDESERVVRLSAQLGLKEATVKKLQEELDMVRKQLTSVGYYSDAESVRTNGLTTPTASTPACSPLPVSTPTPTPNGRGSSADSGVRLSSDRDSTASHDGTLTITVERGSLDCDTLSVCSSATAVSQYYYYACGPGTPKESPSLSPLYATPVSLRGEDQGGENTPSGAPTPTAASINSSAMSGLANSSASTGGLSRSAEQLCERLSEAAESSKVRGSFTLSRKSHKGGGTWGSISRVFARQKKRAALDASLYDGNGSDKRASWSPSSSLCASPLTEESYSEKLRLLEEAQHIPLERWKAPTVLAWLEVTLGMPQYGAMCAENVRSGKVLLELSDSELEAGLGITHPMHRKKLRLAIEELREPRLSRFPRISTLGHTWVSSEWLPDLGLPQYSETFANNLVDGRLLEALTKKELEKHLGVHRKFHQASVIHGVHLLRIVRFDRQILAERRRQSEHIDTDPVVWTNIRWIRWARSIDLAEYADNLKDSGVHGALVVLESSFTADTMATALGIPQSKNIIRRHLATELESLVNPARQQLDEQARYAKMERRRQEKLASGGSLGRSFSRSYGTGLEKGEKDKRRSSLRGSLSRALGLRLREETTTGGNNGGESSSSGGQSPAVTTRTHVHRAPQARPRSSIMPSAAYVHHETHRRVKSIGDIETITVTPV